MKTKKTAFVAVMWLAAFGLLGAPTAPVGGIVPTVGGEAHAFSYVPWLVQCPDDSDVIEVDSLQQLLELIASGAIIVQLFGIVGYEANWICMH